MGRRPHKNTTYQRLRRIPKTPDVERDGAAQPLASAVLMLKKIRSLFLALARSFIRKLLSAKRAAHAHISRRARFTALAGGAAIVTVALLLVLFLPGGAAAPVAVLPSVSGTDSAGPASTPLPATDPDLTSTPVATTEPDPAVFPLATTEPDPVTVLMPTSAPTQKPSATSKPTSTPKPSTSDMASLVAFYRVDASSYYSDFRYSSNHYDYTDEELVMLARIIQAEAGGESDKGKIAVGNVVINRVLCGHYGSTIADQLGGLSYNPNTVPRQSCINAARAVLDDEVWVVPQNTYNFKNSGGEWRTFIYWGQIGNHHFYRYHYGSRYTGDSIPDALYKRVYKYAQYGCVPAERVARIQYMLQSLGYSVTPDKYFGRSTKEALIAFQRDRGLEADGVAGPATVEALIRAFGVDNYRKKYL